MRPRRFWLVFEIIESIANAVFDWLDSLSEKEWRAVMAVMVMVCLIVWILALGR